MEVIAEIRRRHLVSKESISTIARDLKLSRQTVRKHLQTEAEPVYSRQKQPAPKLGEFQATLEGWLQTERHLPKAQRRTARRLFEGLQAEGYRGAYDSVQRFVKQWKASQTRPAIKDAFVPLVFAPGEVGQFDWSHEHVEIDGVMQTIKVAHFRLAYSRQMFVVAYPRETQEMVLDAHNRAFAFFGGVPVRMVYDNLKAVVDAILVGKERQFNRRFLALANHYLFEPVACTPASGWEKGQVENQVGNVREWLFTPLARFASFAALNDWLATRCRELAERKHPAEPGRTIAECFAQEGPHLRAITAAFDGYVEQMLRVSSTCLVRVDRNRYSVPRRPCREGGVRAAQRGAGAHRGRGQRDCRAWPPLRAGPIDLRSLALPAGAGEEARLTAQRRTVPGVGLAGADPGGAGSHPETAEGGPRLRRTAAGRPRGGTGVPASGL
jgi:transposase